MGGWLSEEDTKYQSDCSILRLANQIAVFYKAGQSDCSNPQQDLPPTENTKSKYFKAEDTKYPAEESELRVGGKG